MAKITLEQLRSLREEKRPAMEMRDTGNKTIQIIVGMGTSGIAAGAKDTLAAFSAALLARGLTEVSLRQSGSLGLDNSAPSVEVHVSGAPDVLYGKVTAQIAQLIVEKHIIGKEIVSAHVFEKPAKDIVK